MPAADVRSEGMKGRTIAAVVSLLGLGMLGCGSTRHSPAQKPAVPVGWTRGSAIPKELAVDVADVATRALAEDLLKHQQEEHCRHVLVAVRCHRARGGWDCRWITDAGAGTTHFQRRYSGGIPVTCS
ncbi:MAG: hypothetical protein JWM31_1504 [Solirubrobacterales bacterium]|nr:hypothetical protein [Solirubrobacterales bacterium]